MTHSTLLTLLLTTPFATAFLPWPNASSLTSSRSHASSETSGHCALSVIDVTFSFRMGGGFARSSAHPAPGPPALVRSASRPPTPTPRDRLPALRARLLHPARPLATSGLVRASPLACRPLVSLRSSTALGTRNARAHADPGREASPPTRPYTPQPPRSSVGRGRDLGRRWPSDPSHDGRPGRARVGPAVTPPSSGARMPLFPWRSILRWQRCGRERGGDPLSPGHEWERGSVKPAGTNQAAADGIESQPADRGVRFPLARAPT